MRFSSFLVVGVVVISGMTGAVRQVIERNGFRRWRFSFFVPLPLSVWGLVTLLWEKKKKNRRVNGKKERGQGDVGKSGSTYLVISKKKKNGSHPSIHQVPERICIKEV